MVLSSSPTNGEDHWALISLDDGSVHISNLGADVKANLIFRIPYNDGSDVGLIVPSYEPREEWVGRDRFRIIDVTP